MSVAKRDHARPDVTVNLRYFAAVAEAAGTRGETVELPAGTTAGDLRDALNARHGEAFARQLAVSAFLVDGVRWPGEGLPLVGLVRVDVLPRVIWNSAPSGTGGVWQPGARRRPAGRFGRSREGAVAVRSTNGTASAGRGWGEGSPGRGAVGPVMFVYTNI